MKNKAIVAIWGAGRQGKSETIRLISDDLQKKYSGAVVQTINMGTDITLIIIINNIKIGIESQGDPNSRLKDSLKKFISSNCDIIICGSRSRGSTVNIILDICKKYNYDLIWATNYRSENLDQKELNALSSKHIIELIGKFLI